MSPPRVCRVCDNRRRWTQRCARVAWSGTVCVAGPPHGRTYGDDSSGGGNAGTGRRLAPRCGQDLGRRRIGWLAGDAAAGRGHRRRARGDGYPGRGRTAATDCPRDRPTGAGTRDRTGICSGSPRHSGVPARTSAIVREDYSLPSREERPARLTEAGHDRVHGRNALPFDPVAGHPSHLSRRACRERQRGSDTGARQRAGLVVSDGWDIHERLTAARRRPASAAPSATTRFGSQRAFRPIAALPIYRDRGRRCALERVMHFEHQHRHSRGVGRIVRPVPRWPRGPGLNARHQETKRYGNRGGKPTVRRHPQRYAFQKVHSTL